MDKYDDVIDSRDVIERIAELESVQTEENFEEGSDLSPEELDELRELRAFAAEGEAASPDWQYGATLVRDSYFEDYAREFAEDIGAIDRDASWPAYCIDWEWAARELRMDYTPVDFDGVTYWVR